MHDEYEWETTWDVEGSSRDSWYTEKNNKYKMQTLTGNRGAGSKCGDIWPNSVKGRVLGKYYAWLNVYYYMSNACSFTKFGKYRRVQ